MNEPNEVEQPPPGRSERAVTRKEVKCQPK